MASGADRAVTSAGTAGWASVPIAFTSYLGNNGTQCGAHDGIFYELSAVKIDMITDGCSNTLMVGERPPAQDQFWGWWAVSDYDCLLSVQDQIGPNFYSSCVTPGTFRYPTDPRSIGMANGAPCGGDSNHFWSYHTGGANWLLGDGSVRFVQYSGQPATIAAGSRNGGEVLPSSW